MTALSLSREPVFRLLTLTAALLLAATWLLSGVPGTRSALAAAFADENARTAFAALFSAARAMLVPLGMLALVGLSAGSLILSSGRARDAGSVADRLPVVAPAQHASAQAHFSTNAGSAPPILQEPVEPCVDELAQADLSVALAENQRLRGTLVAREQELTESRAAQSRFVSRISHGLRTPINGVLGMSDLLLDSPLNAEQQRFVRSIVGASTELLQVFDDLLDFARLEVGDLTLERARFSLRDAVEDVCAAHAPLAHARDIELVCHVEDSVPAAVDGDGKRVRQVIGTLIGNALEHTDRGEVVVRLVRESGDDDRSRYRCDVQDSGKGIAPEKQLALWRAFSGDAGELSTARIDETSVLGLAMSVASELVGRMSGDIRVRSRIGEGSRFSVRFELGDVLASGRSSGNSLARLRGQRVLVVDDNHTNRTILEHQLANWDMDVVSVDSAAAALTVLADASQGPFDVGVLDLNMPGMDGLQLARTISADASLRAIPCLMLTSSDIELAASELDRIGIHRNLSKPPRQSELRDTLASLISAERCDAAPVAAVNAAIESTSGALLPNIGDELDPVAIAALEATRRPGKPDLITRIVDGWTRRAPTLIEELRLARFANDTPGFQVSLRAITSSAGTLGALRVAAACHLLEACLLEAGDVPLEQAIDESLMSALAQACDALQPALQALAERAA